MLKLLLAALALFAIIGLPVLISLGAIAWQVLRLRSKGWAGGIVPPPS